MKNPAFGGGPSEARRFPSPEVRTSPLPLRPAPNSLPRRQADSMVSSHAPASDRSPLGFNLPEAKHHDPQENDLPRRKSGGTPSRLPFVLPSPRELTGASSVEPPSHRPPPSPEKPRRETLWRPATFETLEDPLMKVVQRWPEVRRADSQDDARTLAGYLDDFLDSHGIPPEEDISLHGELFSGDRSVVMGLNVRRETFSPSGEQRHLVTVQKFTPISGVVKTITYSSFDMLAGQVKISERVGPKKFRSQLESAGFVSEAAAGMPIMDPIQDFLARHFSSPPPSESEVHDQPRPKRRGHGLAGGDTILEVLANTAAHRLVDWFEERRRR